MTPLVEGAVTMTKSHSTQPSAHRKPATSAGPIPTSIPGDAQVSEVLEAVAAAARASRDGINDLLEGRITAKEMNARTAPPTRSSMMPRKASPASSRPP